MTRAVAKAYLIDELARLRRFTLEHGLLAEDALIYTVWGAILLNKHDELTRLTQPLGETLQAEALKEIERRMQTDGPHE